MLLKSTFARYLFYTRVILCGLFLLNTADFKCFIFKSYRYESNIINSKL